MTKIIVHNHVATWDADPQTKKCPRCRGTGAIQVAQGLSGIIRCPKCGGLGKLGPNGERLPDTAQDADQTQVIAQIGELRSKFQSLHYERVGMEQKARKLSGSEAKQVWAVAASMGTAERQAREQYNSMIDAAKKVWPDFNYWSKIRAGETK